MRIPCKSAVLVALGLVLTGAAPSPAQTLGGDLSDQWQSQGGGTLVFPGDTELEDDVNASFAPSLNPDSVSNPNPPSDGNGPSLKDAPLEDLLKEIDHTSKRMRILNKKLKQTTDPERRAEIEKELEEWKHQLWALNAEVASR